MNTFEIAPLGDYSLEQGANFIGAWHRAPSETGDPEGHLHLAFLTDEGLAPVGICLRHDSGEHVLGTIYGETGQTAPVVKQVERILSLDVDGRAWPDVGKRDPVVARLQRMFPGFRPVNWSNAYEAAAWCVISSRISRHQGQGVKDRMLGPVKEGWDRQECVRQREALRTTTIAPAQNSDPAISSVHRIHVNNESSTSAPKMHIDAGPARRKAPGKTIQAEYHGGWTRSPRSSIRPATNTSPAVIAAGLVFVAGRMLDRGDLVQPPWYSAWIVFPGAFLLAGPASMCIFGALVELSLFTWILWTLLIAGSLFWAGAMVVVRSASR